MLNLVSDMKNKIYFLKSSPFWTGLTSFFLLFFGGMGAIFASFGVCIFCILPILTFILSVFGLSIEIISDYNHVFLASGILFFSLTIYLIKKKHTCKFCNIS